MIQKLVALRWWIFALLLVIAACTGGWLFANEQEIARNVPGFSIKKLEAPASESAFEQLVQQIWIMGQLIRVKNDLLVDYLFMPGAYGSIAMALLLICRKTQRWFAVVLSVIAELMILPWIFDIIENIQLWKAVHSGSLGIKASQLRAMVHAKFAIAYGGGAVIIIALVVKLICRKRWTVA